LQQLESEHDTPWTNQENSPAWKLIIFQNHKAKSAIFDVAFVYHHGLADGLSGSVFHSSLLAAVSELSSQVDSSTRPIRRISVELPSLLTPPVEALVKFNISWIFLASQVLQEYGPRFLFGRKSTPYTGQDCTVSDLIPYRTRLRSLDIDPQTVKQLLAKCKAKNTSMTCLLSLVLVHSLATAVPSAESFIGTIPYTLRPVSGTDYQTMVNQTSALESDYSSELLQRLRETELEQNVQALARQLWEAAEQESALLRTHITNCLNNNLVGLLPYVSDHHEFYRKKLNRKREQTFEVSNIGATRPRTAVSSPWTVERVIFTQGAAVVGPALSLNVASVIDGPSTLTFSWQEKIIEDHIMTATTSRFESLLKALASL
jgi:Alcohol acetyltransferase